VNGDDFQKGFPFKFGSPMDATFPFQTAEPDMTATPHGNVDELILMAELERFKEAFGESNFESWFESKPLTRLWDSEEPFNSTAFVKMAKEELQKMAEGQRSRTYHGRVGDKDWKRDPLTENIHMPSYGKLLDIAMEGAFPKYYAQTEDASTSYEMRRKARIESIKEKLERDNRQYRWDEGIATEDESYLMNKFNELLRSYNQAAIKMKGEDYPGEKYSDVSPTLAATFGEKRFGSEESPEIGKYADTSDRRLAWSSEPRADEDTLRIWADAFYTTPTYMEDYAKDPKYKSKLKKQDVLTGEEWSKIVPRKSYRELLRTLLHEPMHYPGWMGHPFEEYNIWRKGGVEQMQAQERRMEHSVYPSQLYSEITRSLIQNIYDKFKEKDIKEILDDLISGKEIDFTKYEIRDK